MIEVPKKMTWELYIYMNLVYNEHERNYGNDWN